MFHLRLISLHSTMFPINPENIDKMPVCQLTLHSTMFPINPVIPHFPPQTFPTLHSTMFPINPDAGNTENVMRSFTFHYVSY